MWSFHRFSSCPSYFVYHKILTYIGQFSWKCSFKGNLNEKNARLFSLLFYDYPGYPNSTFKQTSYLQVIPEKIDKFTEVLPVKNKKQPLTKPKMPLNDIINLNFLTIPKVLKQVQNVKQTLSTILNKKTLCAVVVPSPRKCFLMMVVYGNFTLNTRCYK